LFLEKRAISPYWFDEAARRQKNPKKKTKKIRKKQKNVILVW